jgi:hypothetical protein
MGNSIMKASALLLMATLLVQCINQTNKSMNADNIMLAEWQGPSEVFRRSTRWIWQM